MINKRGATGEGVLMIYRLVLVSIVAIVVLGISSIFYSHFIDVRDAEARIMARDVVDCLTDDEVVLGDSFELFRDCGIFVGDPERFFVRAEMVGEGFEFSVEHGDSGLTWIKDFFDANLVSGEIKKYNPGYYTGDFVGKVFVDEEIDVSIKVEVLVSDEF